ncbi:MAG: TIGR02270 family protein [Gammaproteobacteria bacterium]
MANTRRKIEPESAPEVATNTPGMVAFLSIIEQHATDAAFLWFLRSQVMDSTLYTQEDIFELDQRIAGHLQGLISAEQLSWEVCTQQLEYEEAGETFVAAVVAFLSDDAAKMKVVCEVALANPQMTPGLVSAFGWVNESRALSWIERFLRVDEPKYRYLGIAACSIRRLDPKQQLTRILQDASTIQHPELYARALRLVGEIKRIDLLPALNQAMDAEHTSVHFWANWSAVLLGNDAAIINLKPYVLEENEYKGQAIQLVFNSLPIDQARQWVTEISKDPSQNQSIIKATAILGDPHAVPWLIQQMNQSLSARLSGLSFSLITGIDLEQHKLDKETEVKFKDNPEGEIEDDAENEDSDLPWPEPSSVQAFWQQHGHNLQLGQRYFLGRSITSESLNQAIEIGNQLQRGDAALKLAMLESNTILLNIASPAVTV